MRFLTSTLVMAALAVPTSLTAQTRPDAPECRASLDGDVLITAIEFPNGYVVEGPWRVRSNRPVALEGGGSGVQLETELDRVIEVDPRTGERTTTPFPEPLTTQFEGETQEHAVQRAAQIWCLSVLRAQESLEPERKRAPVHSAGT